MDKQESDKRGSTVYSFSLLASKVPGNLNY